MITLVDSFPILCECLAAISPTTNTNISLAIDLEGENLCREGEISILQIMSNISSTVWLVDITVLGRKAFDHVDSNGQSLRAILQNPGVKKIFYDVRNDADALFHLYEVDMKGVYDLQLLELAVRRTAGERTKYLHGLGKSIECYVKPTEDWKNIKNAGVALFSPEKGGSYSVFKKRPLDPRILAYCAQDVTLLFELEMALEGRLGVWARNSNWDNRIVAASTQRVSQARSGKYMGQGRHRALAPFI